MFLLGMFLSIAFIWILFLMVQCITGWYGPKKITARSGCL